MKQWGWSDRSRRGSRNGLPRGLRALSVAVPWITVALLLLMLFFMGAALTSREGVLFELPRSEGTLGDFDETTAFALLLPNEQGTFVFFNDQRYILEDKPQMDIFVDQLRDQLRTAEKPTLYVLADARIRHGTIQRFAETARRSGAARILFAEKKGDGAFE